VIGRRALLGLFAALPWAKAEAALTAPPMFRSAAFPPDGHWTGLWTARGGSKYRTVTLRVLRRNGGLDEHRRSFNIDLAEGEELVVQTWGDRT
jgi:hypothetical protein